MPASHSPNSVHSHLSPKSYTSGVSPKAAAPNPRLNPFAPLSPDMPEGQLELEDGETGDIDRLLGIAVAQSKREKLLRYSREELLRVALKCQKVGWTIPKGLGSLDTWFGSPSVLKAGLKGQHMDDPAIASIDPTGLGESSRRGVGGQYEQGFGYGGGIGGGRGLGRGGKNVGLRRQEGQLDANGLPLPDHRRDAFGGQMGRFSMRAPGEKPMRLGGDEMPPMPPMSQQHRRDGQDRRGRGEGDWRNKNGPPGMRTGERRSHQNWQQAEDDAAPAWMDDGPNPEDSAEVMDPAIAGSGPEPMFNFTPGEDMIAAHRRTKGNADDWRGGSGKQLVSFFGGEAPVAPVQLKPKSFNAADYLLPSNKEEEVEVEEQVQERPNAYTSRFAKFFGGAEGPSADFASSSGKISAAPPQRSPPARSPQDFVSPNPPPQSDGLRVDDHMSRLMGLLKTSSPAPPPHESQSPPDRGNYPPQGQPSRSPYDNQSGQQPSSHYDRSPYAQHEQSQPSQLPLLGVAPGPGPSGPPGMGRGYGGPPPHPLLQQLYQGRNYDNYQPSSQPPPPPPSGPDLLHLLTQGQSRPPQMPYPQGPPRPPQTHHSMPPNFGAGPMRSPEYREDFHLPPHGAQQPYPNGQFPPHMYGPQSNQGPPKGYGGGPPGYPPGPGGMQFPPHAMQVGNGHQPPGFRQGSAQQDMLATLASLGRT